MGERSTQHNILYASDRTCIIAQPPHVRYSELRQSPESGLGPSADYTHSSALNGGWPGYECAHIFSVHKTITLRGCKDLFEHRSFWFLPDFELTGDEPVLNLIGGQDMDMQAVRQCLLDVAFAQCAFRVMKKTTFAIINMHFPLRPHEEAKVVEAWNGFNDECRGGARLKVWTGHHSEYLGVEQEQVFFASAGKTGMPPASTKHKLTRAPTFDSLALQDTPEHCLADKIDDWDGGDLDDLPRRAQRHLLLWRNRR